MRDRPGEYARNLRDEGICMLPGFARSSFLRFIGIDKYNLPIPIWEADACLLM